MQTIVFFHKYLVLFQEILTLLGYYLAGLLLDLIFRLIGVYLE